MTPASARNNAAAAPLERGLGLLQSVALNVNNMVGIGPFITIPLFISAMQGPQAMIGCVFLWVTSGWTLVLAGLGVIRSGCAVFFAWRKFAERGESASPVIGKERP